MFLIYSDEMNFILSCYCRYPICIGYDNLLNIRGIVSYDDLSAESNEIIIRPGSISVDSVDIILYLAVNLKITTCNKLDFADIFRILRYFNSRFDYNEIDFDIRHGVLTFNEYRVLISDIRFPSIKKYFKSALFEKCKEMSDEIANLILEFDNPDLDTNFQSQFYFFKK